MRVVEAHQSVTKDSGTYRRTSHHVLSCMINIMSGKMEVSEQLTAASLLVIPKKVLTEQYTYCFIYPALNFFPEVGVFTTVVTVGES